MSICNHCHKETGNKLKFCNKVCRDKFNDEQNALNRCINTYGDSYDPWLALWVATLVPAGNKKASKTLSNPKILSNVGHILLERIAVEIERHGEVRYFQKLYKLERY
jgi:hypothetical protein